MMKSIILNALFITSVLSKGPCDQKLECAQKTFGTDDRALCTGYRGCYRANFGTTSYNPVCSGAQACRGANIIAPPSKILCNGFEACLGMKDGFTATEKIACNGLKSCRDTVGELTAPMITCDGDIACNLKKLIATGTAPAGQKNAIYCNGNKACTDANLVSDGKVVCDGDSTCKDARIAAKKAECAGKRSCYGSRIVGAGTVYGYGFNAANLAEIYGPDQGKKSRKDWTFEIRGLGMNSFMGAMIDTNGAYKTSILGYGFKALVGARIKCVGKSQCAVTCRINACKDADIYIERGADIIMDPIECDPRDANYVGASKKDPTKPGKAQGVNCPTIRGPGARLEDADLTVEEWENMVNSEWKSSIDYYEMIEAAQIAEQSLDAIIAEKVDAYLDLSPLPEEEEEFMVAGHLLSTTTSDNNNHLQSNLLTALTVFIMTSVGSLCYIAYRFGGKNDETKALLSFDRE